MGALCSNKSENPTHLEPPRSNNKTTSNNQTIGVPKGTQNNNSIGLLGNMSPEPKSDSYETNNGNLKLDVKTAQNIKVQEFLTQD